MGHNSQYRKRGRGFIPNEELPAPHAPLTSQYVGYGTVSFYGDNETGAFYNLYQSDTLGGTYVYVAQLTAADPATVTHAEIPIGKYWKATQLGNGIVTIGESPLSGFKLMS